MTGAAKRRLSVALAGLAMAMSWLCAAADDYPNRPLKFIVPWPPGGTVDVRSRLIAQRLERALQQPVVVDNRPGASGTLGMLALARAVPDGYTLAFGSFVDQAAVLSLMQSVPYDPAKDFVPIAFMGRPCYVLVANPKLGVSSVKEFVALARSQPGQLNYASGGIGTPHHLFMETFKHLSAIDLNHVPYKGAAPALNDVLAGHVPAMFDASGLVAAHVQSGKLKPLLTTCAHRIDLFPEVPSASEAGYRGLDLSPWGGVFVPTGTPPAIVERLNREINKILAGPDIRSHIAFTGYEMENWSAQQFADFIKRDRPRWAQIIKTAGIKPDQ